MVSPIVEIKKIPISHLQILEFNRLPVIFMEAGLYPKYIFNVGKSFQHNIYLMEVGEGRREMRA